MRHVRVAVNVLPHAMLVSVPTRSMRLVPHTSLAVGMSKDQLSVQSKTLLVGQSICGGVVSTTVTVWLHCAVSPHPFMACQVRVAEKVLPQKPALFVVVETTVTTPLLEEGGSKSQGCPHSTVLLVAQVMDGGLVVTINTVQFVTVLHWPVTSTQ